MPRHYVPARLHEDDWRHLANMKAIDRRSIQSHIDQALAEYRERNPVNLRAGLNKVLDSFSEPSKRQSKRK